MNENTKKTLKTVLIAIAALILILLVGRFFFFLFRFVIILVIGIAAICGLVIYLLRRRRGKRPFGKESGKKKEDEPFTYTVDADKVFFTCPKCAATLRVPKGKGRIEIRCPRCSHAFEADT